MPEDQREALFAIGGPLVRNVATPKGSAVIFTEALSHGAAVWQRSDAPRYSLFYKYNDRATVNGYPEDRRPSEQAFRMMTGETFCSVFHFLFCTRAQTHLGSARG